MAGPLRGPFRMSDQPKTVPDAPPTDQTADIVHSEAYETANVVSDTAPESAPKFGNPQMPDEIGTLGPYRVLRELGRGGMGAVYLGFDERLKRKVALKVMLPKYAAIASSKNRFLREARAAAGITHDHIVTIYEADEHAGTPYMAMQLLQGYPLDVYLKRHSKLELGELLRIGREMALGLAAAHSVGLIHRDIKPGNIWLEAPNGRVKILDFGLAKPTDEQKIDGELTATGVIVGTPAYMPPEQARGAKADFRADLFSLGVVLYRLATGTMPFNGDTMMAMLAAVIADDPIPVRELNPNVPEPLAKLIHELMEKKPQNRPKSANEVAERLQQIQLGTAAAIALPMQVIPLDALPTATYVAPGADPFADLDATDPVEVVSRPAAARSLPTMPAATKKPTPKWSLVALGLFLLVVAALVPQIISMMTPKGTLVIESNDPDVEITVKQGSATLVDKSKGREFTLKIGDDYTIDMTEKDGLKLNVNKFEITRNGRTTVKVVVQRPPPKPKPDPPTPAIPSAAPIVPLAWQGPSPLDALDAAKIPAAEKFDWQPKELIGVLGTHAARHWGSGWALAVSPDGLTIATGGTDKLLRLWDATTLQPRGEIAGLNAVVQRIAFSKDGRQILTLANATSVPEYILCDLTKKVVVERLAPRDKGQPIAGIPFIASDGRLLTATFDAPKYEGSVRVVDIKTGALVVELKGHPAIGYIWTAFAPDGTRFATLHSGHVQLWDAKTGNRLHSWNEMKPGGDNWLAFSPDGKWITASSGGPGPEIDLHLWDVASGKSALVVRNVTSNYGMSLAFSRDGYRVVIGGDGGPQFHVVDLPSGKTICRIDNLAGYREAVFNADASRIVTFGTHYGVGGDGVLRSYDAKTGQPAIPLPAGSVTSLALATDLATLLTAGADQRVRNWNLATGTESNSFAIERHRYNDPRIVSIRGGKSVLVLEQAPQIRDLVAGTTQEDFATRDPTAICRSTDGKSVAVGYVSGRIEAWDVGAKPAKMKWSYSAHSAQVTGVEFSPDGTRLVTCGNDHNAFVWDVAGTAPKKLYELGAGGIPAGEANAYEAVWSPDGKRVAVARGHGVALWDVGGKTAVAREVLKRPEPSAARINAIAQHPSLPWLAVADGDGRLTLWNTADATLVKTWQFPASPSELAFAADGRHLLTANPNGTVYVLRLDVPKPPADPERAAALWALGLNAQVVCDTGPRSVPVKAVAELPAEPFTLDRVDFAPGTALADADLAKLEVLKRLRVVIASGTPIGDDGVKRLSQIITLTDLHLADTKLGDDGFATLTKLRNLRLLTVAGTAISGKVSTLFHDKSQLENVNLHNTAVNHDLVWAVSHCPKLATLHLSSTKVTDTALAKLETCASLRHLTLGKTGVTAAGVKKLAAALPLCKIQWNGGTIEPKSAAERNRAAAAWLLARGANLGFNTHTGFRAIEAKNGDKLPDGDIELKSFALGAGFQTESELVRIRALESLDTVVLSNAGVGDGAVEHLLTLPLLTKLYLSGTKLTDRGLKALEISRKLVTLHLNDTTVTEAGVKAFAAKFPNCEIEWKGGTIRPGTAVAAPGNHALEFDGTASYVSVPTLQLETDQPVTIEARVRLLATKNETETIASMYTAKSALLLCRAGGTNPAFLARRELTSHFAGLDGSIPSDEWVHVVGQFDGKAASIYVNGKLVRKTMSRPVTREMIANQNQPLFIGAERVHAGGAIGGFLRGQIDGLRISKVARYAIEFTPPTELPTDADTVANYSFDDGAGDTLADSSGNKHHGTIVGAKWVPIESSTRGLAFDGKATVVRIPAALGGNDLPLTLEAWITPKSVLGKSRHLFLYGEPGGGMGLSEKGNLGIGFFDGKVWHNDYGRGVLVPGKRVHVAAVVTAKKLELFLDGQSNGNKTVKIGRLVIPNPPALIGKHPMDSPEGYFHGTVHALRVSKTARYDKAFTPVAAWKPDADTIAQYHFDEGEGTKLTDHSGNGHHGVIENGTWAK
jgi:serine/threonine protein kinase/WD40 repeat protein